MAELGSSESDYFVKQLECPICFVTIRPPIFQCPAGHSVCSRCYESLQNCPQCSVSYGKVVADIFDGQRLMKFRCPRKCYGSNKKGLNGHRVVGNGLVVNITCFECKRGYYLIPYKGKLILGSEFDKLKAEFRPPRNYGLEAMTACLLYPCEAQDCQSKFKLADEKEHMSICIYRVVKCPCQDCDWKGPFNSLYDHFMDSTWVGDDYEFPSHPVVQRRVKFILSVPKGNGATRIAIMSDAVTFPDSVFGFCLLKRSSEALAFRLFHYGTVPSGKNIDGKVIIYSHENPSYFRAFGFPVQNDLLIDGDGHDEELPSLEWLKHNHFIDSDVCMTVEIDFWRNENFENASVDDPNSIAIDEEEAAGNGVEPSMKRKLSQNGKEASCSTSSKCGEKSTKKQSIKK